MSVPRRRRRLPDEVRAAAVRAVLSFSFTLVGIVVATLASYAGSSLLTPALMAMGLGVFGTMWCLLEILISRQVAAQRLRAQAAPRPQPYRAPEPLAPRPLPRPGQQARPGQQPRPGQQQARSQAPGGRQQTAR
ncbi:hypothetical protein [Streptomyces sp. NRRL WC-3742]|uniref:hypothetical protein n=1 Tax=Streptomyces sp. NRRL WC-3742 TaxID=1463934 RepID=UPI000B2304CF|nr:hypothetical protein [Streptomyces sp. NRRL WC-3742]